MYFKHFRTFFPFFICELVCGRPGLRLYAIGIFNMFRLGMLVLMFICCSLGTLRIIYFESAYYVRNSWCTAGLMCVTAAHWLPT